MNWADPDLDFTRYSSSGVIGDATHATPALGRELWDATIDEMSRLFATVASADAPIVQPLPTSNPR